MSESSVGIIVERIKVATKESPIAVFRCPKVGMLNAVFAATRTTQLMIAMGPPDLIGIFGNDSHSEYIRHKLNMHVTRE